ncbi:MAG: IS30 family transposase [Candidatus Gribaldobacteria bacterium]|nr:IS30 family transposase [Candidatus Gribaldobacteria bacterium]
MGTMGKRNHKKIKGKQHHFKQFNLEDRIRIEIKYREGCSFRAIAKYLGNGRSASSVIREIAGRPRRGNGKYTAYFHHQKVLDRRFGKKTTRLKNDLIRDYAVEKLKLGWSPEQISLRLPIEHKGQNISYEAVYQYVYAQVKRGDNGNVKKGCEDLRPYLARRHQRRQKKGFRQSKRAERDFRLPSIENRPAIVKIRKEVGHFEDDTISSRQSLVRIKSINERSTGVVFLGKMNSGASEESTRVVCEKLKVLPSELVKTLTRDRGTENMGWENIEKQLNLKVYFAHAYSSYERGSNENLNGLVRRYFPKKTDFAKVTDEQIQKVEYLLNTRPRKRFGGRTPLEVLFKKTGVAITY